MSPTAALHDELTLRPFAPGDEAAFQELTEEWVKAYFELEEKDKEILADPKTHILDPGGHIVIATLSGQAVGCCALLKMENGIFEVAKMGVSEKHRGLGIGRKVLERVVEDARHLGATRLYLETNRKLANAIHLYESIGFQHVPVDRVHPSPYVRANVFMEMELDAIS